VKLAMKQPVAKQPVAKQPVVKQPVAKQLKIAVLGATGLVGQEMIKILEERDFPVQELRPLASAKSAGSKITFRNKEILVQEAGAESFKGIDIALFSAGTEASLHFAPIAAASGAVVIDNSNAFRMDKNVPLVIPEVNPNQVSSHKGIIANPNCSTIQMLVALNNIHKKYGLKKVIVSTYQSVSGTGKDAVQELLNQTNQKLNNQEIETSVYPHQIAFNVIPQIDVFEENGYTREEMKMVRETHKILADDKIKISATAVRVPVIFGHSESIFFETENAVGLRDIKIALEEQAGLKLVDDPTNQVYPLAIDTETDDDVMVGRLRKDLTSDTGFSMWVVGHNLRKGAALNAVQIAELVQEIL